MCQTEQGGWTYRLSALGHFSSTVFWQVPSPWNLQWLGRSKDIDPILNVAERSITWLLMLKNLPETSTIKREEQPNKRHIGESSRRPVMASKMPIKISPRRRFTILLTKSRNFFAFWVWCCENCTGIIKRRSLHNLQGSLLQKAAAYIDN